MKAAVLLLAALLASCGDSRTPQQTNADNQLALDNPEAIGRLPDGRVLYHSTIKVKGIDRSQEIYYAGTDLTVNVGGKVPQVRAIISAPRDIVIIDGQRYDVNEVRQALVRDEDQRRKEKQ